MLVEKIIRKFVFNQQVLNQHFDETCSVSGDLRSVLFMLFNPVEDELITGGVGGTKVKISKNDGTPQGRIYQYSETFLNRNPV